MRWSAGCLPKAASLRFPGAGQRKPALFLSALTGSDGTFDLYGPAPQAFFSEQPQGRLFERILSSVEAEAVSERLQREARMDPDYWLVEVEARDNGTIERVCPCADDGDDKPSPGAGLFKF